MIHLKQLTRYLERIFKRNSWHWLCNDYAMDTPIVYGLISLFIAGCTPSQDPTNNTRLKASKEVLAPVSESFQIVDAAFLDSHRRVKSEGNLYAGKLHGQLRLTLKSNDTGLVPRFSFDAH